jgi:hypothetical protein
MVVPDFLAGFWSGLQREILLLCSVQRNPPAYLKRFEGNLVLSDFLSTGKVHQRGMNYIKSNISCSL